VVTSGVPYLIREIVWDDGNVDRLEYMYITTIPEPGTMVLLLVGMAVIWPKLRRGRAV
jgi:hypothetical protein